MPTLPFTISGRVAHGKALARQFDMPTANIEPREDITGLAFGVYFSKVIVDGREYRAITNLGVRPTVQDGSRINAESFIYDFDGDLYDKEISVILTKFKRPETKFSSVDDLFAAIRKDIEDGRLS